MYTHVKTSFSVYSSNSSSTLFVLLWDPYIMLVNHASPFSLILLMKCFAWGESASQLFSCFWANNVLPTQSIGMKSEPPKRHHKLVHGYILETDLYCSVIIIVVTIYNIWNMVLLLAVGTINSLLRLKDSPVSFLR